MHTRYLLLLILALSGQLEAGLLWDAFICDEFITIVVRGSLDEVRSWLDRSPRYANAVSSDLKSAIMYAAMWGHKAIVEQLIAAGAQVSYTDTFWRTALSEAIYYKHTQIAQLLLANMLQRVQHYKNAYRDALKIAIIKQQNDMAILLLPHVDINSTDEFGNTLLITVAQSQQENIEIAQLLLAAGAQVTVVNKFRSTALQLALVKQYVGLIKLLLEHRADTEQIYQIDQINYYTPLYQAIKMNNTAIVKLLLQAGADPDKRCGDSTSPLVFAIGRSEPNTEIIELLLDHGADIYWSVSSILVTYYFYKTKKAKLEKILKKHEAKRNVSRDLIAQATFEYRAQCRGEKERNILIQAAVTANNSQFLYQLLISGFEPSPEIIYSAMPKEVKRILNRYRQLYQEFYALRQIKDPKTPLVDVPLELIKYLVISILIEEQI